MARQAGLGKSLHEVLEALTPAESLPDAPRLAREQLEHELDELIEQVQALREQVAQLTRETTRASSKSKSKKNKGKGKKKK